MTWDRAGNRSATRIGRIMTMDPACCTPQDSIMTAARLMTANRCSCLPVVEARHNGRLVGMVTSSDIATRTVVSGCDSDTKVSRIMSSSPVSCSIDDDVEAVRRLMTSHHVRRIPVVDEWGCCIGIVTDKDLRALRDHDEESSKLVAHEPARVPRTSGIAKKDSPPAITVRTETRRKAADLDAALRAR